jgi:hypothetical protein
VLKKVLRQEGGLLVAATGGLLGIAIGISISHLRLPLYNAIISDFVVLLFFGVAPFLLAKWADDIYLVLYALVLIVPSIFSLGFFAPAAVLLLIGALLRFFRRVE